VSTDDPTLPVGIVCRAVEILREEHVEQATASGDENVAV
jgi:hypothetical protein